MVEVANCWMENFNENLQAYFKEARQDRICSSSWQPKKKKKTIIHFENLAPMVCHEFP